jgi:glucosamine--fructose-6-phosphate aminotransferase (isomerizing)
MCGIIGYVGNQPAKKILLAGLERLEYRGYDSAGIALFAKAQEPWIRRAVGPVKSLVDSIQAQGDSPTEGIAHTRWATHGVANETNAHPHRAGRIVLVHNGIIENYSELRDELGREGAQFSSQTDSEVFARLIDREIQKIWQKNYQGHSFDLSEVSKQKEVIFLGLKAAADLVHGHYAIVMSVKGLEGHIFGIQNGAPLVSTETSSGVLIASDLQALISLSKDIRFIPPGVCFDLTQDRIHFYKLDSLSSTEVKSEKIVWSSEQAAKDGYEYFMQKEIFQQPHVVADTLSGRLPLNPDSPFVWENPKQHDKLWAGVERLVLVGCGTAYHAALTAKYFFEKWARLPVEVDLASEYRYRNPLFLKGTVVGVVSQSGETADTLGALRLANQNGAATFSICNVPGSTIFREAQLTYQTKAGPEIGVASTKAFTTQLTLLASLALDVARLRGFPQNEAAHLARLPHDMEIVLAQAKEFENLGAQLKEYSTLLFVGRGTMYPIALEGALKLKEITYRHAEGYAAGELKHGPIALVDKNLAAVVLAPSDDLNLKTLSNLEEIKSRGAFVIGIGREGNKAMAAHCHHFIGLPECGWASAPMLYVLPLQLMSYGLAKALDCNIDKPRNLAKSVTVE